MNHDETETLTNGWDDTPRRLIVHQKRHRPSNILFDLIVFNATFSNISAISWRPVLVVEEAGENHRPWASN